MSVGELARRVGVSEPTVIRLCRRLGYKGFRDFKDALLTRITRQTRTPSGNIHQRLPQLAASKVLESCARSLLDVSGISQNLPFETAAERLRPHRTSYSLGWVPRDWSPKMQCINSLGWAFLAAVRWTRLPFFSPLRLLGAGRPLSLCRKQENGPN